MNKRYAELSRKVSDLLFSFLSPESLINLARSVKYHTSPPLYSLGQVLKSSMKQSNGSVL